MKILWKGNVFNPTGIATANREICKALLNNTSNKVQTSDIYHSTHDFNEGLACLNNPMDCNDKDVRTVFADYPNTWNEGFGRKFAFFLHEGTKIPKGWADKINQSVEKLFVPSKATKNLFKWNNVNVPIEVIPYGDSECYKPSGIEKDDNFIFLSVNSWTGKIGDRKGTDLLIKAFDEEFQPHEKVTLVLKIGTFWAGEIDYPRRMIEILGHDNENIMINSEYMPEKELVEVYNHADCFVSPTRGEAFGLTIAEAKACGLPVIVTKDSNSGHMDFCNDDSTLFIDTLGVAQADPEFFCEGNYQPVLSIKSLRDQMRYAYQQKSNLGLKGLKNSEKIRKELTWENTAAKLIKSMK